MTEYKAQKTGENEVSLIIYDEQEDPTGKMVKAPRETEMIGLSKARDMRAKAQEQFDYFDKLDVEKFKQDGKARATKDMRMWDDVISKFQDEPRSLK